jgi:ketosteroid isomerase-like protein
MSDSRVDQQFAEHFASNWVAFWNAHDLERILSHYADDFEMSSPVIVQIANEPTGTLRGKAAVGAYWDKALQLIPDLKFELLTILVGVGSITLYYMGARSRLAAEVFHFGPDLKVTRAFAHYASGLTFPNPEEDAFARANSI